MIIDAHVHLAPSVSGCTKGGFVKTGAYGIIEYASGERVRLMPPSFTATESAPEPLLEYMEWQGVDRAVIMQSQLYGEWNAHVKAIERRYPDKFTAVGTYDPYVKNSEKTLMKMVAEDGFRTVKLECSADWGLSGLHTALDYADDNFRPLWRLANERELTVVIDTGEMGTHGHQMETLGSLAAQYRKMRLVIAHLGFPPENRDDESLWHKTVAIGRLDNVWFDIANILGLVNEEYPFPLAQHYLEYAHRQLGARKLIFGSDYPGVLTRCTYRQALQYVQKHCRFISPADLQAIMGGNALSVYQIK